MSILPAYLVDAGVAGALAGDVAYHVACSRGAVASTIASLTPAAARNVYRGLVCWIDSSFEAFRDEHGKRVPRDEDGILPGERSYRARADHRGMSGVYARTGWYATPMEAARALHRLLVKKEDE